MSSHPEPALEPLPLLTHRHLFLNTAESIHLVRAHEIIRCEAANNYTSFFLSGNRKIVVCKSLGEYAALLEQWGFIRVHQSHLINIQHLARYDKRDGGVIVMQDQSNVPVSSRKKEKLLQLLRN